MRASRIVLRGSFLASSTLFLAHPYRCNSPYNGGYSHGAPSSSSTASIRAVSSTLSITSTTSHTNALHGSRRCVSTTTPYGSVPSDIDSSRREGKPSEEDVLRNDRRRTTASRGGRQSAEEAHAELINGQAKGYNPWEVLGLKSGASNQTIRRRYHELMKEVHPDMAADGVGDIPRLNQINKAYELITKSPTLDRRFRNLVTDKQYFYYRYLPEWMARNVDEMPRYWSWVKWRTPGPFQMFLLLVACYALGRFFAEFPKLTTVFVMSMAVDVLLHTMIAPATLSMLFLYSILAYRSYDMAWLTSPKGFLRRELGY